MTTTTIKRTSFALPLLPALAAALVSVAALAGLPQTLGLSDRAAFIAVFVIGFALCAPGIGRGMTYGWAHPLNWFGYITGAALLVLAASVFFGWSLPWITGDRMALTVLAAAMLAKSAVSLLYPRRA